MQGFDEILDQSFDFSLPFRLGLDHGTSHALGYYPDLTLLPLFPHPMRYIKEHALEEQHERHPLIVRVIPLLAIIDTQTRMGHVGGHGFRVIRR